MAAMMLWLFLAKMTIATSTVASWINPRGAIIQNAIVLEGGFLSNATKTIPTPGGLLYNISLCKSFDSSTDDIDKMLFANHMEETLGSPVIYVGGAMFASDYEFYTYG